MADSSGSIPWGFVTILAIAALLYAIMAITVLSSRGSDAAGGGLAVAFGIIEAVLMWIALLVLLLMTHKHGPIPGWSKAFLFVLVPLAAICACVAIGMFSERGGWLLLVPLLAPLVMMLFVSWARFPSMHGLVAVWLANVLVIATLALAAAAPFVAVAL